MKWVFSAFVVSGVYARSRARPPPTCGQTTCSRRLLLEKSRSGGYLIRLPSGQNSREDAAPWSVARRLRLTVWNRIPIVSNQRVGAGGARMIRTYGLFIWEVVKAHVALSPKRAQTIHHRGEGEFMIFPWGDDFRPDGRWMANSHQGDSPIATQVPTASWASRRSRSSPRMGTGSMTSPATCGSESAIGIAPTTTAS